MQTRITVVPRVTLADFRRWAAAHAAGTLASVEAAATADGWRVTETLRG